MCKGGYGLTAFSSAETGSSWDAGVASVTVLKFKSSRHFQTAAGRSATTATPLSAVAS